jgi:hypothetical protein
MSIYDYTRQNLFSAISILSTSPGDVRSRINNAYKAFNPLKSSHFPDELKKDWEWIIHSMTKYGPKMNYKNEIELGSVEHTMRRIKNSTGTKIAGKIFDLFYELHFNDKYL